MNVQDFIKKATALLRLVNKMRAAQKAYFLNRSQERLVRAQALERQVDASLMPFTDYLTERIEDQPPLQLGLTDAPREVIEQDFGKS
jgi:hypothetical protein